MASQSSVVFYRYDGSPFSNKIDSILLLKDIPHVKVDVSRILPRPELSELLGVAYRRIPILAIGNDVYCDTSLIASALERRFPPGEGYGTIFPTVKDGHGAVDSGIQKAYSTFYCDRSLFRLATGGLSWQDLPQSFLEDRSAMIGAKLNPQAMMARQPVVLSELASHMDFAEEQLSDGREWLFNTEAPSFGDISLHFVLTWMQALPATKGVLNERSTPKTLTWLGRLTHVLSQKIREGSASFQTISGKSAAELIGSADHESPSVVGFNETEASRLGLSLGLSVNVAPDDSGQSHPTQGKLVGLNREEIVVETSGTIGASVRVHFPRLNFMVKTTVNPSPPKL